MATSMETPTGDSITSKLQDNTQTYSLSEVTSDLMDAHAHRPGLFSQDLAKVNESIDHLMPGLDIVGIDGKDLLARDEQNQMFRVDTANPENRQAVSTETREQAIGDNGRVAQLAEDGSGKYTVVGGDSCWRIADDILTSQGVAEPTDNQIANYIKELEQHNGRSFASLQIGDEINIPTMVQGSEESAFAADSTTPDTPIVPANADASQTADGAEGGYTPLPTDADGIDKLIDGMTADKFIPDEVRPGPTVEAAAALDAQKQAEQQAKLQAMGAQTGEQIAADLEALKNGTYVNPNAVAAEAVQPETPEVLPTEYNPVAEELMLHSAVSSMNVGFNKAFEASGSVDNTDPSISLADIENALTLNDLSGNESYGLNTMRNNFDFLKDEDGKVRKGAFDRYFDMRKREIAAMDLKVNGFSPTATPSVQETMDFSAYDDGLFDFAS